MANPEHSPYVENDEVELDLRQILEVLKKWGKLIIAMSLIMSLCAGLISKLVLDRYIKPKPF